MKIILVLVICLLYFINAISGINHAGEINDESEKEHKISMLIGFIILMLSLGFCVDWNFNGWAIAFAITGIIAILAPKPEYRASVNMVIIGKLSAMFFLYKAGFFNCLL